MFIRKSVFISFILLSALSASVAFSAITPTETADESNPFVQFLESQYKKIIKVQNDGDLAQYRLLRSKDILEKQENRLKASNETAQFSKYLKETAHFYAAIEQYHFLKCDTNANIARLSYSKQVPPDAVQERIEFLIIMFHFEANTWKIGQVVTAGQPKFKKDGSPTKLRDVLIDQSIAGKVQLSK